MDQSSDFQFWEDDTPFDDVHGRGKTVSDSEDRVRGACSPQLWRRALIDFRRDTSPLLSSKHEYSSSPSPSSRLRAIVDGRRELMEMIKDMPESSYELSLKDMVDKEESIQEKEVILMEETKPQHKMGGKILQKGSSHVRRTESMDSEAYLLRMFLPTSLSFSKKTGARKKLKSSSGQAPERPATINWRKITSLIVRSNRNSGAEINRSVSDVGARNSKPRRRQGCLF